MNFIFILLFIHIEKIVVNSDKESKISSGIHQAIMTHKAGCNLNGNYLPKDAVAPNVCSIPTTLFFVFEKTLLSNSLKKFVLQNHRIENILFFKLYL